MPRFDLIDEFTTAYVPKPAVRGPVPPRAPFRWKRYLAPVAALVVAVIAVIGL